VQGAILAALLAVLPTYGPMVEPAATPPSGMRIPVSANEALILKSNSTNTAGYRLRVSTDGWTTLQQGDVPLRKRVSLLLVKHFFADLRAAGPLDRIAVRRCMKSMSFGTTLQIVYEGKASPDISCPSGARQLVGDALALAEAAGASLTPRPLHGNL
jgi:hypothetical protein